MSIHLPTPDCWRLGVLFTNVNTPVKCEMTFALYDPGGVIAADPATFAGDVFTEVTSNLVPVADSAVFFNGIALEDVGSLPYGGVEFLYTAVPGTKYTTGTGLPTSVCIAVKRTTAALGRSGRGRLFWPLWNSNWLVSADQISSADAGAISTGIGDFHTGVKALISGGDVGIISLQTGGAPRPTNGLFEPVLSYICTDERVDNQRRRLLGRGQ